MAVIWGHILLKNIFIPIGKLVSAKLSCISVERAQIILSCKLGILFMDNFMWSVNNSFGKMCKWFCLWWSTRAPVTNMFDVPDPTTSKGATLCFLLPARSARRPDVHWMLCPFKRNWVLIPQASPQVAVLCLLPKRLLKYRNVHIIGALIGGGSRCCVRLGSGALPGAGWVPSQGSPCRRSISHQYRKPLTVLAASQQRLSTAEVI